MRVESGEWRVESGAVAELSFLSKHEFKLKSSGF